MGVLPGITSPAKAIVKTPMSAASVPLADPSIRLVSVRLAISPPAYYTASTAVSLSPYFVAGTFGELNGLFSLSGLASGANPVA